jgi:hypothetical protein
MCSARDNAALPTLGFPIRASAGHWLFSASPRLIAAVHALHRLLVPRHPPCALTILTVIWVRALRLYPVIPVSLATVQFSRSAKRRSAMYAGPGPRSSSHRHRAGLSKLNSMRIASPVRWAQPCDLPDPVDMSSGRSRSGERRGARKLKTTIHRRSVPSGCGGLPRKEVIQPQLPLRLPCYDFTPVAGPTFDGTLPKGLGNRLRVLLTPMV